MADSNSQSIDAVVEDTAAGQAEETAVATTTAMAGDIAESLPDTTTTVNTSSAAADVGASITLAEQYRTIAREEAMKMADDIRREHEQSRAAEIAAIPDPEPIVVVAPAPAPEPVASVDSSSEVFPDAAPAKDEAPPKTHPYYRPLRRRQR